MPLPERCAVVFDLDDTLYQERDYVESGFRAVAEYIHAHTGCEIYEQMLTLLKQGELDVFGMIITKTQCPLDKAALIQTYRDHQPALTLSAEVAQLLGKLLESGCQLGIITDGRSLTQRNKIRALGLEKWINEIVISEELGAEKPSPVGFLQMQNRFASCQMVYVGDNPTKGFVTPNRLGWITVCLRATAKNIHPQELDDVMSDFRPDYLIDRLS
mgnify:FL=1